MRNRKKHLRVLSTSDIYTKRLKNRTSLAGGVTVDRSVAIDRIRNSSLGLSQNILKPTESNCSFVYNPSSYGEGFNYDVYPNLSGSDFAFTRADAVAKVTNKDGSIGDSCYNLLQQSEAFSNSYWVKNDCSIDPTPVNGPDGTARAYKLVENTTANQHFILPTAGPVYTTGTLLNLSVYVKPNGRDWIRLGMSNSTNVGIYFNVSTGVIGNVGSSVTNQLITYAGNGYYRCSFSIPYPGTGFYLFIEPKTSNGGGNYTGDGVSGIFIFGAQISQSTVLKDYLKTTNRLAVPRIDYSLDLTKPSLLIEPQSTNLALQSENIQIGAGTWINTQSGSTANTNLNPFGVNKSYYIAAQNNTAAHSTAQSISVISGTTYTSSYYVKKGNDTWVQFYMGLSPIKWVNFNFDTGLFGNTSGLTGYTSKILTNGYYLITITGVSGLTGSGEGCGIVGVNNTDSATFRPSYLGVSTNNICDVAACQFEAGATASKYIATTTATVTRNGETSFVDLQNNGLLTQNNFTLFVDGCLYDGSGVNRSIALADTTTGGVNDVGFFNGIKASFAASSVITSDTTSLSSNTAFKIAIQRSGTSVKFFRNGAQIWSTQTTAVVDYRYLIINNGGSTFAINKIELYKETLSDAVLITKTT